MSSNDILFKGTPRLKRKGDVLFIVKFGGRITATFNTLPIGLNISIA